MGSSQAGEVRAADAPDIGLFSRLKGLSATLLATGRTRLELLGNEIEEEKLRALRLLLLALAAIFCAGVAVLLLVVLFAVAFWESRVLVIGGFAALFVALCGLLVFAMGKAAKRSEPVFAHSLAELEEDLRQLKAAARNEPP